jgi:hypothetical protein
MSDKNEIVQSIIMAGAGIILGGLIASVASKEEKEEVKKVSFAPTSDER